MPAISHRGTLTHAATPQLLELLRLRGVPARRLRDLTEDEALDLLDRNPPKGVVTAPPPPPLAPPRPTLTLPPAASRILVDRHRDRVEEVHLVEGRVARVRRTADGERYAEPWDEVAKRYGQHEPGLVARTSEATRLDPHRAAEHGRAWGHCMVCGRLLTASASVTSGIGPKCVVDVYGYDARAEIVAGIEQRSRITAVTS